MMEAGEWRERETLDQQGQFSQGGLVAHTVQYVHFHSDKTDLFAVRGFGFIVPAPVPSQHG